MKNVYVLGSINTDLVISSPYIPKSGETVTGSNFFTARGGKGANQAVACARLGGNVLMCGCVGNDAFGLTAVEALKQEGIGVSAIRAVDGVSTGTAVIIVTDGDNRIILDKGANAFINKFDIDMFLKEAKAGDIFLTQLENPIDVIGYGLCKAREKGMYVILNPAPADAKIKEYLGYCDLVVPNESEAEILGGAEELSKIVGTLLVTLGGKGFLIKHNGDEKHYPCISVDVIDTTAAGDTLCGGLCAELSKGKSLRDAALFGSMAASIACTKKGAQTSIPTRQEVERYIKEKM